MLAAWAPAPPLIWKALEPALALMAQGSYTDSTSASPSQPRPYTNAKINRQCQIVAFVIAFSDATIFSYMPKMPGRPPPAGAPLWSRQPLV
jgi:hypothetical protein